MDHVTLRRDGAELQVEGRVEVTAQDGGMLLLARDGVLWRILPEEQVKHTHDDAPFRPFRRQEMTKSCWPSCPRASRSTRRRIT